MFSWFSTDSHDQPAVVATPVVGNPSETQVEITMANLEGRVIHLATLVQELQSKLDAFTWKHVTQVIGDYSIYQEYRAIVVDHTTCNFFHDRVLYPIAVQDTRLLFEFSGSGKGVINSTNRSQMIFVVDGNTSLDLRCQKYPAKARSYQVILQSRGGAGDIPEPEPEPQPEPEPEDLPSPEPQPETKFAPTP
jgi:hypothetical protein